MLHQPIDAATAHREIEALRADLASGRLRQSHGRLVTREQITGAVTISGGIVWPGADGAFPAGLDARGERILIAEAA